MWMILQRACFALPNVVMSSPACIALLHPCPFLFQHFLLKLPKSRSAYQARLCACAGRGHQFFFFSYRFGVANQAGLGSPPFIIRFTCHGDDFQSR